MLMCIGTVANALDKPNDLAIAPIHISIQSTNIYELYIQYIYRMLYIVSRIMKMFHKSTCIIHINPWNDVYNTSRFMKHFHYS